jgi:hypothetical protein
MTTHTHPIISRALPSSSEPSTSKEPETPNPIDRLKATISHLATSLPSRAAAAAAALQTLGAKLPRTAWLVISFCFVAAMSRGLLAANPSRVAAREVGGMWVAW